MGYKVLRLYICNIKHVLQCEFCRGHCQVSLSCAVFERFCFFCLCRKGQQLEPSEQYIFNRLEGGRGMLTIRNIRQGDGGTYTCKATNKAGSQEREIFLKVFGKDKENPTSVIITWQFESFWLEIKQLTYLYWVESVLRVKERCLFGIISQEPFERQNMQIQ